MSYQDIGYHKYLKEKGLPSKNGMENKIDEWDQYYSTNHGWYNLTVLDMERRRKYSRKRASLHPARMVAQEWASLILNERTQVVTDEEITNIWLNNWIVQTRFMLNAQELIERAFALGTGALVLQAKNINDDGSPSDNAYLDVMHLSGKSIIPISYKNRVCTECAFVTSTFYRGKKLTQLLIFTRGDDGVYQSSAVLFDKNGNQVNSDQVMTTHYGATQPFALIRPAISNTYQEHSPMGVSVYDDAVDAIKQVDRAWDNMGTDIETGQRMVFLSEDMLARDDNNKFLTPYKTGQNVFMVGENDDGRFHDYTPDLRVDENTKSLETALNVLGLKTGMGKGYWTLDNGSMKTATEVISEQSDLYRWIRKHENVIAPALETLMRAAIETWSRISKDKLPEPTGITIQFDDSVIEDTNAMRARDREDVGAGLMAKWEYRKRWYGESEEQAKIAADEISSTGYEL